MTVRRSPVESAAPEAARVLVAARHLLFTYGYLAFTMDELAHELGMSKKTLYRHFPAKDAIIERIVDDLGAALHRQLAAVVDHPTLGFTDKVAGVVATASATLGKVSPTMLRELQRFAPKVHAKIDAIRQEVIPLVFGRLIRDGMAEGKVRRDIDPAFATEFWLQAIRGLVQPATLERTQLTLPQTLERALPLFFAGLLTPAGRKDYENHA
jgi:AcrR family transcriptional regulator